MNGVSVGKDYVKKLKKRVDKSSPIKYNNIYKGELYDERTDLQQDV